jgi:hypothetical protein
VLVLLLLLLKTSQALIRLGLGLGRFSSARRQAHRAEATQQKVNAANKNNHPVVPKKKAY